MKLARSAIADTMTMSVWTNAVILDKCPSWIKSRMRRRKVAIGNMERNAGARENCFQLKLTSESVRSFIYISHGFNYPFVQS